MQAEARSFVLSTNKNCQVVEHPLIQHKLTLLRDKNTNVQVFRDLMHELSLLLTFEAAQHLATETHTVQTPLEEFAGKKLSQQLIVFPILRAGMAMTEGVLKLLPKASMSPMGFYRDEKTLQPKEYYFRKMTVQLNAVALVCDPMLATGGTAVAAIEKLKQFPFKDIIFMSIIAAPEGVEKLHAAHPNVKIFTASLDRCLNDHAYIVPGLGDAGDRYFGS
jgi:uracil phosphoribosyltransferase